MEFGSDAADKGLAPNMLVIAVNDRPTPDIAEWERVLDRLDAGAPIKLDVLPPGQTSGEPLYFFLRKPGD